MIVLKYIGAGAYIPGVPATDLTAEQVKASGYTADQLLAYSPPIYEKPARANEPAKAKEN